MDGQESRGRGDRSIVPGALAALLLAVASASFMLGITLPIMRLDRFFILSDSYSLIGMVKALFADGEVLLALILLVFSIVLPAVKIILLSFLLVCGREQALSGVLHRLAGALGKWSMLDVLLVALVIFAAKTSGVASAVSLPGLYFFCLSVLATMAGGLLARRTSCAG
jgi:paraquat-inducible protein A